MISCPTIRHRIQESLDRPLDEADRRAVDTHLADCAGCRAYQAELKALDAGLSAMPRVQAPPALLAGLATALDPPSAALARRRRVPSWAWSTAAGVLVLVGLWRLAPGLAPSPIPENSPGTPTVEASGDPLLGWIDADPPGAPALLKDFDPVAEE